ncbi:MAG: POTRA domain-containing protein [Acidobacteriota bacterium]
MSRSADDFRRRPLRVAHSDVLAYFCAIMLFLALGQASVLSQQEGAATIGSIEMLVDGQPDPGELARLIPLREGEAYSLRAVDQSVKQIYSTGLFSSVEVIKSGEERVSLRFLLTRKLLVRQISFRGEKGVSRRKLMDSLYSLRPDSFFSDEKLRRAVEELRRALNDEGYFQPKFRTSVRRKPRAPEADISFEIEAGVRYLVSDVAFLPNGVIPEEELRKEMRVREGELYDLGRLEEDLSRLREMHVARGYPRAEVDLAAEDFFPENGTVSLTIRISPGERIEILITGAEVPLSLVAPIWEERIFEEWGVSEGEARILTYLRDKGYVMAEVKSSIEVQGGIVRVIHAVNPRKKYKIHDVRFEGLHVFSAAEIKKELGISEPSLFFGILDGRRVFEVPREIKAFCQSRGYPGVEVDYRLLEEESEVTVVYEIEEGGPQRIQSISFLGAALFDSQTLRAQISLTEGGPYFPPAVQRDVGRLERFYLDQAIRGTTIGTAVEEVGDGLFRVDFVIREGRPVEIQNIFIAGNLVTRKSTILRELRIKEGQPAHYDRIATSKQNLERLGIFSEVSVEEIPVSQDRENVIITVREGERNYVGLGVGLETRSEPWTSALFQANLRLRGTAEFMRGNIFGRAANLSFVSQFSLSERRAVLSWEQPYFLFAIRMPTYLNGWVEEEDRESFGFKREGISVSGIRPAAWDLTLLTTLRYARTTLTYLEVAESAIDRQFSPYSTTSLSTSVLQEKRNDAFNPGRGHFSSLALEWAFPLFQTESDFFKGVFKYQHFFTLLPRTIINPTFRLGLGVGKMPIHERFFAGGSNSFRGREFDKLGSKDPESGKPVGGKALVLFNLELTFPLTAGVPALSGAVFYDAGNVLFNRSDLDLSDLEHAVGLGVRYRTPLGPVRLELGWNLNEPERKAKPLVFITIGNVF